MHKLYNISLFILFACSLVASEKVVLISGSTGGIGQACIEAFQKKGWHIWAGYRHAYPEKWNSLENVKPIPLDVTDDASVRAAICEIINTHGKIDALINNAGYGLIGADESVTIEESEALFDVNFFGALRLIQAVTPFMRDERSGHIINISSTSGVRAVPGLGHYAASKFALEGLSESLAITLSPWNIKVVLVEPGTVKNEWTQHCHISKSEEPLYEKMAHTLSQKLTEFASQGQACSEIGALILSIAEEENPHMRYQTSQKVSDTLAEKLVDLSGDKMRNKQTLFFQSLIQ